jgi:chromosomal replication initiator protein
VGAADEWSGPESTEDRSEDADAPADARALIIATLRNSPLEAPGFTPRLLSRLCRGLTVPLAPPGAAARRALVRSLAEAWSVPLTNQAADLLADELPLLAGALEGVIQRLKHAFVADRGRYQATRAGAGDEPIDASFVQAFLMHQAGARKPTLRSITAAVARRCQIKAAELKGAGRKQSVVLARGMAMYLARQATSATLEDVGAHFGGRDHTTVLHACRKIESQLTTDPDVRRMFSLLCVDLELPANLDASA